MKKFFQYLKTRPLAFISLIFLCLVYFIMIFADFFAPYPATMTFENNTYHPSNIQLTVKGMKVREYRVIDKTIWKYSRVKGEAYTHSIVLFPKGFEYKLFGFIKCDRHLFGTKNNAYPIYVLGADHLGRDLFSRIIYGSRISLTIGFVATFVSLIIAVLLGGLSGYFGGVTDWSIMRLSEFFMLIPSLYFILFLRSLLNSKMDSGTSYMVITLILSLVGWPGTARTIRGIVHAVKREDFVVDAALEGVPPVVIIFKHIIPQISSLLIVSITLSVPGFIMSETTLSYLGLGISDPAVSWGSLINRDISTLNNLKCFPWLLYPVLMLLLVTLAFNFLGDCLRDFYDPYNIIFNKKQKKVTTSTTTNASGNHLLEIRNLFVDFFIMREGKKVIVHAARDVSYYVDKQEILGLVGESGSGKSVSTTVIPLLLPGNAEYSGEIFYEGKNLSSLSKEELRNIRGKEIGLIFQEPGRSFDPLVNIGNLFYETLQCVNPNITKQEANEQTVNLLSEVGIPEPESRLKSFPHQFSGGQLQRIGIALALAQNCKLLIADEPTTALDVTIQAQIVSLLMHLKKTRNLSIIFISHNIDLVAQISDRIAVMYGGKIMETGAAKQILENPKHPYTQALISALPKFGMHYTKNPMNTIPGKVADPTQPPNGCPFYDRCRFAKDSCNVKDYFCYKLGE